MAHEFVEVELKHKIVNSIDQIQEYIGKTVNFVEEQAPIVVQEMLNYGKAFYITGVVVCLLILLGLAIVIILSMRQYRRDKGKNFDFLMLSIFCGGVSIITFVTMVYSTIIPLLQIYYAPRLYVLEQIKLLL